MNISGALGTLEDRDKLSSKPWGELVVSIANVYLSGENLVTLDDTGTAAMIKIMTLDDTQQAKILTMKIGDGDPTQENKVSRFKLIGACLSITMVLVAFVSMVYSVAMGSGENRDFALGLLKALVEMLQTLFV